MGNTIKVKSKEKPEMFEVTEKLIKDFQYHINLVDRSVVGLGRSIDSMRASCTVFRRDTKDAVDVEVDNGKDHHGDSEAGFLLETINDVVSDHKFVVFETLSRFFTFIIDNGSGFFTSESETMLSVDKYRHQNSSDAELGQQYYDTRIESLQNKIKTLNKDYQSAKEDIEMFNKRDFLYIEEKKILRQKEENLIRESAQMKSELKKISNAKFAMEQSNEKLKNEIKSLRWSEKKILSQKEEKTAQVNSLTENINKMNAELNNFKHQHKEEKNALIECLQQEQKKKEEIVKELHDLKDEMKQRTEKEEKDVIEKVSSLEMQIQRLTADVRLKQIKVETLEEKHKSEMDAIVKEKSKLQQDLKEKETKEDEMETRLESLHEVKAKSVLIEANLSAFTTVMSDEIKTMNSNLRDNHTLAECLKLEQTTKEQSVKQLEDLKAVIQQQKVEKQQHEDKIKLLMENLQEERRAKEKTMSELHDFKEMNQRSEEGKKEVFEKVSSLEMKIQRLTAEVKEKQIEIETLAEKYKSEVDAIVMENSKLQQDLKEKMTKGEEMEIRLESLQEVKTKTSLIEANLSAFTTLMNDEIKTMKSSRTDYHTLAECLKLEQTIKEQSVKQLEDLKAVIQQQKEEKQQHEDKIKVLKEYLQEERKAKEENIKELHQLKEMNQQTTDEKKDVHEQVCLLEMEIQRLTAEVNEKQTEVESLTEKHKTELGDILNENTELLEDLKEKQTKSEEIKTRLQSLQESNTHSSMIETKITDFMTIINDEIKTMNTSIKENNKLTAILNIERETKEEYLKQLDDFKGVQQQQNDECQEQVKRIKVLSECVEKDQREKDELIKELEDLKDVKNQSEEENKGSFGKIRSLESEMQRLTAELKEKQIQVESIEEYHRIEMDSILKENTKLQQDLKEKQAKAEEMEPRLQEAKPNSSEAKITDFVMIMKDDIKTMNANLIGNQTLAECPKHKRATQDESAKELEGFKADQEQQKEEHQEQEKGIKTLTECVEQEQRENQENIKEQRSLKDEKSQPKEKRKSFTEEVNLLKSEIQSLTTGVKEKQTEIETLKEKHITEIHAILKEKTELQEDLKEKQTNVEELETRLRSLHEANTNSSLMETKITNFMTIMNDEIKIMNTYLKECLKHEKTTKDEYAKELEDFKVVQQQLKENIASIDEKQNHFQREYTALAADVTAEEIGVETFKEQDISEVERCHNEFEKLKHEQKEQKEILKEQTDHIKSLDDIEQDFTSAVKTEVDMRAPLMESHSAAISSVKDDIDKTNEVSAKLNLLLKEEIRKIEELVDVEKKEKEECLKQLNEKQIKYHDNISKLNDDKKRLTTDVEEMKGRIKSLELELVLASRKVINVQVYHQSWFRSQNAEDELRNMLKTRLATENINLQFLNCSRCIVQPHLPMLIVCSRAYIHSREKNISNAMKSFKDSHKKTALVIFNDKDEKAFKKEVDTSKDDRGSLRGIFDINYKDRIYDSEINSRSIEGIIQFIKRESRDMESIV